MAKFEIVSKATGNVIAVSNSNRRIVGEGFFFRKIETPATNRKSSPVARKAPAKIGSKVKLFMGGQIGTITGKAGRSYTISVDGKPQLSFARDTFEVID
jgi:hypothetical protein